MAPEMNETRTHVPILVNEILTHLAPKKGGRYLDCTFGMGGHSRALLSQCSEIALDVIDQDGSVHGRFTELQKEFSHAEMRFHHGPFSEITEQLHTKGRLFDGVIADLGFGSHQLDDPERGFSFRIDAPLDLRMDPTHGIPAWQWLEENDADTIRDSIRAYGEEPLAGLIAQAIKKSSVRTTKELSQIVDRIYQKKYGRSSRTPPATKTFQALRIEMNQELHEVEALMKHLPLLLNENGVAAVLTFHSLEDRIVKDAMKRGANPCTCPPGLPMCVCGKKTIWNLVKPFPQKPTSEEVEKNSRAHSASLRVVRR